MTACSKQNAVGAFDSLAEKYDALWTNTLTGRLQRQAVWRHAARLVRSGDRLLDLGCGTGEDALHFAAGGIHVTGIDSSSDMVRIACGKGVDARLLPIEEIRWLDMPSGISFDGAISNFGALNCVSDLAGLRRPLADKIRPGGYLIVCVMGRFCLWETIWYAAHGQFRKASRRWWGTADSLPGLTVYYPATGEIKKAFSPEFLLTGVFGIGVCVPPSFVSGLSRRLLRALDSMDRRVASWPGIRALSDHRLLLFTRTQ